MTRSSFLLPFLLCACVAVPVETTSGREIGIENEGMMQWLGIRYAEPPVGALRFAPPVPRAKQTTEHQATAYGASCEGAEDCLFLNVWAPKGAEKLPVMVFIHGGAFTMGSGGSAATLSKKGNVVTVTLNYRLGVFGFMAHGAIAGEAGNTAGNYGLLDQQLAMTWVRDNIAAFGGDPSHVTLFGESAGGISVCSHLVSPRAKGLFQGAIAESGPCVIPYVSRAQAATTGDHVAAAVGCTSGDVAACLRAAPAQVLRDAVKAKIEFDFEADHWGLVADGDVLPLDPYGAFERGEVNAVPFLSGANGNEGSLFTLGMTMDTRAQFEEFVGKTMRHHVAAALEFYSEAAYPKPKDAATAMLGDMFVCGARKNAAQVAKVVPQTYLYHFTRANPTLQGNLGSTHASEIPYVFGEIGFPLQNTPADAKLSDTMIGYWSRFARTGDPNGDGAVVWPTTDARGRHLVLDTTVAEQPELEAERCNVLETWLPQL